MRAMGADHPVARSEDADHPGRHGLLPRSQVKLAAQLTSRDSLGTDVLECTHPGHEPIAIEERQGRRLSRVHVHWGCQQGGSDYSMGISRYRAATSTPWLRR